MTHSLETANLQLVLDIAGVQIFLEELLPEALDWLRQMVAINSYTANPEGVNRLGRLTAECFAPLGFSARTVPSTNPNWGEHLVLTRTGNSHRNLAMVSHLDTVFPPEEEERNRFHWLREGSRIFGPGTHDIKGGTVMMWLVLSALRAKAPQLFETMNWQLLWNSSEEEFSPDFGQLCSQLFDPGTLAALVFESEGRVGADTSLVVARKGRATWRLTVNGRGAHAGGKHEHGANAIVQLARTIGQVAALTDYDRQLTFNVGTARGGTVLNRVPHEAISEGEFRSFTPEVHAHAKGSLLAFNGPGEVRSSFDGYACQVRTEILSECPPWPRNDATLRVFEAWREAGAELGLRVHAEARGGLSDANHIWTAAPTLDGLGPWGDNDHCSERSADGSKLPEFVDVSSFVPKALLNTAAIVRLVSSAVMSQPTT